MLKVVASGLPHFASELHDGVNLGDALSHEKRRLAGDELATTAKCAAVHAGRALGLYLEKLESRVVAAHYRARLVNFDDSAGRGAFP